MTTVRDCSKWIYGPQVSDTNRPYSLGGNTWWAIYNRCTAEQRALYNKIKPYDIYDALIQQNNDTDTLMPFIDKLKSCKTFSEILLIHSAFINAYAIVFSFGGEAPSVFV